MQQKNWLHFDDFERSAEAQHRMLLPYSIWVYVVGLCFIRVGLAGQQLTVRTGKSLFRLLWWLTRGPP